MGSYLVLDRHGDRPALLLHQLRSTAHLPIVGSRIHTLLHRICKSHSLSVHQHCDWKLQSNRQIVVHHTIRLLLGRHHNVRHAHEASDHESLRHNLERAPYFQLREEGRVLRNQLRRQKRLEVQALGG